MLSAPLVGIRADAAWQAMHFATRHPAGSLVVDQVALSALPGGITRRSMRLVGKPGQPQVIDNVRVNELAKEITVRPVVNGVELAEERVFALRTGPLRFKMLCRRPASVERLYSCDPRSVCTAVFDRTAAAAEGRVHI